MHKSTITIRVEIRAIDDVPLVEFRSSSDRTVMATFCSFGSSEIPHISAHSSSASPPKCREMDLRTLRSAHSFGASIYRLVQPYSIFPRTITDPVPTAGHIQYSCGFLDLRMVIPASAAMSSSASQHVAREGTRMIVMARNHQISPVSLTER